jgi:hypothetical protein
MQLALSQQSQAFEQSSPVPFGLATGRSLADTKSLLPSSSNHGDSVWWTIHSPGPENNATANLFLPTHRFPLRRATREQNHCTGTRRPTADARCEVEPEQRLWKISKETASLNFGKSEWIVFLFFGVVAIAATAYSFSELFHLLGSGSVAHTVEALLTR